MEIKDMGKCCALEKTLDHNDSTYSRPKGKFSINYLRSISSFLGFTLNEPESGDDVFKIDATIRADSDQWCIHKPLIDFQAKTTSGSIIKDGFLNYQIDTKTLNNMRNSSNEHILVILHILEDPEVWVEDCENGLLLHEHMYWFNPKSAPADYEGESVTLHVPTSNMITRRTLHQMMDLVGRGGEIGYEL